MLKLLKKQIVLFFGLSIMFCCVLANELSLSAVNTGKYFCPITVSVNASNITTPYGACQYRVSYNPLTESVKGSCSIGNDWNQASECYTGIASGVNVFYGVHSTSIPGGFSSSKICSSFTVKGISTGVSSSILKFVDKSGSNNIVFNTTTNTGTLDEVNLSSQFDTLTAIHNKTIAYEPCPCRNDNKAPIWIKTSGRTDGHFTGYESIAGFINDRDEDNSTSYWFSGNKNFIAANYVGVPEGVLMDNQLGVDSGTIGVKIIHSANRIHPDEEVEEFKLNSGLNIVKYEESDEGYKDTWNGNDRGYLVSFVNSIEYDVERPVTIEITGADNTFYMGNSSICNVSTPHSMNTVTYTFNSADNPTINITTPSDGSTRIKTTISSIKFRVDDTWAGVNTGEIRLTIPEIWSGTKGTSGAVLLLTGYTYSGSDLQLSNCVGEEFTGGGYGCTVTITPKWEFPPNKTITLQGYVEDFVKNTGSFTSTFTTMQSASALGCGGPITIYYVSGALTESPVNIDVLFTGSMVVLTGLVENNQGVDGESYPRFVTVGADEETGEGGEEILMCSPLNVHPNLTGNIKVWSGSEVYTGLYDDTKLYITGLNWSYQSGVIVINNE